MGKEEALGSDGMCEEVAEWHKKGFTTALKQASNASREGANYDGEVLNGDRMMSISNGKA